MTLSPQLLQILVCPVDKGGLYYLADEDALYNPRLHRRYAVREGIPVMLVEEAQLPEGVGSLEEFKTKFASEIKVRG